MQGQSYGCFQNQEDLKQWIKFCRCQMKRQLAGVVTGEDQIDDAVQMLMLKVIRFWKSNPVRNPYGLAVWLSVKVRADFLRTKACQAKITADTDALANAAGPERPCVSIFDRLGPLRDCLSQEEIELLRYLEENDIDLKHDRELVLERFQLTDGNLRVRLTRLRKKLRLRWEEANREL